jgi:hypothetical protein
MKLHEQVVAASQQQQASHGRPMGLRYEVRMAGLVLKLAWQQAWLRTCSVLGFGPELVEQENNESLLTEQAAALARIDQLRKEALPLRGLAEQRQVSISNSLEDQWVEVALAAEVRLASQATKVAFLAV